MTPYSHLVLPLLDAVCDGCPNVAPVSSQRCPRLALGDSTDISVHLLAPVVRGQCADSVHHVPPVVREPLQRSSFATQGQGHRDLLSLVAGLLSLLKRRYSTVSVKNNAAIYSSSKINHRKLTCNVASCEYEDEDHK